MMKNIVLKNSKKTNFNYTRFSISYRQGQLAMKEKRAAAYPVCQQNFFNFFFFFVQPVNPLLKTFCFPEKNFAGEILKKFMATLK